MKITITNPNNGRRWRLRPYTNGLCLLIEKSPISKVNPKNGKTIKSEFVSCDRYPSTWDYGLEAMLHMMMNDPEDGAELKIDDPADASEKLNDTFERWLSNVKVEIERN